MPPTMINGIINAGPGAAQMLRELAKLTGAPVTVHNARIEDVVDGFAGNVEAVTARALAPLTVLCGFAGRHLGPGGTAVFPKGQNWQAEVDEARKRWKFDLDVRPSLVEASSVVLVMKAIVHV